MGVEVFHALRAVLQEPEALDRRSVTKAGSRRTSRRDEEALEAIMEAIEAPATRRQQVRIAIDAAASEL